MLLLHWTKVLDGMLFRGLLPLQLYRYYCCVFQYTARYVDRTRSLARVNPRKGLPYVGWRQTERLVVVRCGQFLCWFVILHFKL